ncbi:MAG TPA: TetR/AcrR family transcriptional regulator [Polyangiaceae bacterium]
MSYAAYLAGPERRRRILDSAKRVFARRGYHDTNISHICDDLRIARGTLYQYFQSKKDVFVAIVEEMLERVRAAVAAEPAIVVPPGFKPTREQVLRYTASSTHRVLQAVFADEESLRILVREAVGLDVGIDAILHAIDDIVIDRFAADMKAARDAGILRADIDPRASALFVLGGIQKLALDALSRDPKGTIDLRALAIEATRINLLGLLSPEVT